MRTVYKPLHSKSSKNPAYVATVALNLESEEDVFDFIKEDKSMAIITKIGINRWKLEVWRGSGVKEPLPALTVHDLGYFENLGVYPDFERAILKFKAEVLF